MGLCANSSTLPPFGGIQAESVLLAFCGVLVPTLYVVSMLRNGPYRVQVIQNTEDPLPEFPQVAGRFLRGGPHWTIFEHIPRA